MKIKGGIGNYLSDGNKKKNREQMSESTPNVTRVHCFSFFRVFCRIRPERRITETSWYTCTPAISPPVHKLEATNHFNYNNEACE